jgi:transcriptional regulator with XRE-family HTH domain
VDKLGKNIKKYREALGYTQEDLAAKLGYKSRSTINKIEMGINDISQSKIVEFAKVLKVTPSDLMGWEDGSDQSIDLSVNNNDGIILERVYLSLAKEAQISKLSPELVKEVIEIIKKFRQQ